MSEPFGSFSPFYTHPQILNISDSPSLVINGETVYLFWFNYKLNNHLHCTYSGVKTGGTHWEHATLAGTAMSFSPYATVLNNRVAVFYQGVNQNKNIYYTMENADKSAWTNPKLASPNAQIYQSPAAIAKDNETVLLVYYGSGRTSSEKALWHTTGKFNGDDFHWTGDEFIPNTGTESSPQLVKDLATGGIFTFHRGGQDAVYYNIYQDNHWGGDISIRESHTHHTPCGIYNPNTKTVGVFYVYNWNLFFKYQIGTGWSTQVKLDVGASVNSAVSAVTYQDGDTVYTLLAFKDENDKLHCLKAATLF